MGRTSTNGHFTTSWGCGQPPLVPYVDLCFEDGNLAILTGTYYFLVHKGLLCRHSKVIDEMIKGAGISNLLEGRPVLMFDEQPWEIIQLLQTLYDGGSSPRLDATDFTTISSLLRLVTKLKMQHLREDLLRNLADQWPSTLSQWEFRDMDKAGHRNRESRAHPILIINLAYEIDAPALLPSAFYDLSRMPPSQIVMGLTGSDKSQSTHLSQVDSLCLFRGREQASRSLSAFIINELEGRQPSALCKNRDEVDPISRRTCQIVFEAITFELLRHVNGATRHCSSDPLRSILEAKEIQTWGDHSGAATRRKRGENISRETCKSCSAEFGIAVDRARVEFWHSLPAWFGVQVEQWP